MSLLYIAEKPSLARAIIQVLPKPHQREDGFYRSANGDIVSWCIGHLLELADPSEYNSRYKKWILSDLPIIPTQWKLIPKQNTLKQLNILKQLIENHQDIVHVGDPDREGQLLIDELFSFFNVPKIKRDSIKRCFINDLNPNAVTKSLARLKNNVEFSALSTSALARSRSDWLYGINLSRLCTLKGRNAGYNGVLSIGRVQTPILGLVVQRDNDILNFVSKPFYELWATIQTENNEQFKAKWQPSEHCHPHQDDENRIINLSLVEHISHRIKDKPAQIITIKKQKKNIAPPLIFNLSQLQIEMAKRFNLSAQIVLDNCQSLYEKHKLITYPRSDCQYLPEEHFNERHNVIHSIDHNLKKECFSANDFDIDRKNSVWDDKKVDAHHGIIPTQHRLNLNALSEIELKIYDAIAMRYVTQFYSNYTYHDLQIDLTIEGGLFIAKAPKTEQQGWKQLTSAESTMNIKKDDSAEQEDYLLSSLTENTHCTCLTGDINHKTTTAPKPFNDATLLSAMTGIARFVSDKALKSILRETDGLGTEATRAGIIELLFKRGYLVRQGRSIRATDIAHQLINALPNLITKPDMTAEWEIKLNKMSKDKTIYHEFMGNLEQQISHLIADLQITLFKNSD